MPRESFQDMVPPTRIGIKLEVDKDGAMEEIELPLRLLVLGDFTLSEDPTELQLRKARSINKDNFDAIMKDMNLGLSFAVPNRLANDGSDLKVDLKFESMKDFDTGGLCGPITYSQTDHKGISSCRLFKVDASTGKLTPFTGWKDPPKF